jgi:predicted metal-dependent phosphoesterase TrpH
VAELEQLQREFAAIREPATAMGRISLAVARMYATFALYQVRERAHHPEAARLREQILRWDPDGILAVRNARAAKPVRKSQPAARKGRKLR